MRTDTRSVTIAPGNAAQLDAWDGSEGAFWADHAERFDETIARHHRHFLAAMDLRADARVLDVGCGTGQSTRDAARRAPRGAALGVDLSARMLDVARARAAQQGLGNVAFEQADAEVHPFGAAAFDLIAARTATMFFADKPAGFANLAGALRLGGQLVLLVWQAPERNEWFTSLTAALAAGRDLPLPPPDGPHPFSMADPVAIQSLLTTTGLREVVIDAVEEPMYFGEGTADAFDFVHGLLGWMIADSETRTRGRALRALRTTIEQHRTKAGVLYDSAAWLVTARR